jgi:circadian clock protein KaiC
MKPRQHVSLAVQLPKTATLITGLDDILDGGLPTGKTTLISGGPGCGKSMLGLEILYRNALAGAKGIYVAFEEKAEDIRRNARSLGWNLSALEESGMLFILDAGIDPEATLAGDFSMKGLVAIIQGKSQQMGASLIVIDAIDVLVRIFDDVTRERNEIIALHSWLSENQFYRCSDSENSLEPRRKSPLRFSRLFDSLCDYA